MGIQSPEHDATPIQTVSIPPREFATRETDKTRFWLHSPSSIFRRPKPDDLCSLLPPQFLQPNITTGVSDTQIVTNVVWANDQIK